MAGEAALVHDAGMHIEDIAKGLARPQHLLDGGEVLQAGAVKLLLAEILFADHHRAHHGGMVMGADAGPFQCQLILAVEETTACLVAA